MKLCYDAVNYYDVKNINVNSVISKRWWIWITLSDRLIYTLQSWMQGITHRLPWSLFKFHLITSLHVSLWDRHSLCCSESISVTDRKSSYNSTSSHTRSYTSNAHHKTRGKKRYWIVPTILTLSILINKKILILHLFLFFL